MIISEEPNKFIRQGITREIRLKGYHKIVKPMSFTLYQAGYYRVIFLMYASDEYALGEVNYLVGELDNPTITTESILALKTELDKKIAELEKEKMDEYIANIKGNSQGQKEREQKERTYTFAEQALIERYKNAIAELDKEKEQ